MSVIRFPPLVNFNQRIRPARYEVWSRWLSARLHRMMRHVPTLALELAGGVCVLAMWLAIIFLFATVSP